MDDFYDQLTPFYHLIYQDWDASIALQGEQLKSIIAAEWPGSTRLLDVSCGIGTQAIALTLKGFSVTASDLSISQVARAQREASLRHATISFSVGDMCSAFNHHGDGFDVVISADNSLPHLLTDEQILVALKEMYRCVRPGGGCLITVRDYEREERGKNIVKLYGIRLRENKRYLLFQVWDFEGEQYDLTFFFVEEDLQTKRAQTHALRSRCYAISTVRLIELMQHAGFGEVTRLDGVFNQPVVVGTKLP